MGRRLISATVFCFAMATGCVFCNIAHGKDPDTTILFEDEKVVVFKDIKPAATHHYLAIPKEHIRDASRLKKEHVELVNELLAAGKQVLEEQGGNIKEARYGFHWPPLVLVGHVHLHIIAPESAMGFLSRLIFRKNSYWFTTVDYVIDRLKAMPDDKIGGKL